MSTVASSVSSAAATLLRFSPSAYLKSWLLYLGIQTHVRGTVDPELKPLHNVCEYLNALHVYADEARQGKARTVESFHFCSHVSKEFRQCLIYDSNSQSARLIGVEYMIPKHKYETLDEEERKLWHSHEFEVESGMLVLPAPPSHRGNGREQAWEKLETEAMKEVIGWYGKTYHLWQVDRGDEIPLGEPKLMGSLTGYEQVDVDQVLEDRNQRFQVDHKVKKSIRATNDVKGPGVSASADSWWAEARSNGRGIYANH